MTAVASLPPTGTAISWQHPVELDRLLGDPSDHTRAFCRREIAALDGAEEFPTRMCAELDQLGLPGWYVPAELGGRLDRLDRLAQTVRVVAGRDLTAAIAHAKTFLGSVCVWLAGDDRQRDALAAEVLAGAVVSWGLTEPGHGADLLAGELTATATGDGYRIDGTKWLINNATRADLVCLLARTDPAGGPRGFTVLLVDKRALPAGSFRCLPKEYTHGIRGADISGISFTAAPVPADAVIGQVGDGVELVLRALQVTRTACVALSLGAADHALRLAHGYAADRVLYQRRLIELAPARRALGRGYAALFAAEAVSLVAARYAHLLPGQLSVVSAVVKSFVPALVDELIAGCGELLGARAFLTEEYAEGMFQKVERDHRIVGIFDGSTFVNRAALINQFPLLARAHRRHSGDSGDSGGQEVLRLVGDLAGDLPPLRPGQLTVLARGGCDLTAAVAAGLARVRASRPADPVVDTVAALAAQVEAVHRDMADYRANGDGIPATAYELAARYETCFAAAAVLQVWLHTSGEGPLYSGDVWARAALHLLLDRLAPGQAGSAAGYDRLLDAVEATTTAGRPISIVPVAGAGDPTEVAR